MKKEMNVFKDSRKLGLDTVKKRNVKLKKQGNL